jgi:erythromycin esterase
MRNLILIIIIVLFSNSAFVLAQQTSAVSDNKSDSPAETQAVRKWLASRAIPLKSVQAETGISDLKPLKSVFKDVRIVALGESSHGQREFFQFKHRMLEFLVTQMGFTAFSLEASYPACMNINEYVVYGRGDPGKALTSNGFSQFDTQEVLEMVEWMRQYNSKLPEAKRIKFLGYDMQGQYQWAMDAIPAYLKKVAPDYITEAEVAFAALKAERGKPMNIAVQSAAEQAKSIARLEKLHSFLAANRHEFVRQTSEWDFDVVLLHARVLVQGANYAVASSVGVRKFNADKDKKNKTVYSFVGDAIALRDVYMAENVATELKMLGPKSRMVISGHNGHIGLAPWGDGLPGFEIFKIQAMGNHMRKKFGDEYYALGFDFYSGSFQANERNEKGKFEMREFLMPPASEGTAAWYLKTATQGKGFQDYVINLRDAPKTGLVAEWLSRPLGMTVLGGGFSKDRTREEAQAHISLKDYFDGLLFVEETTRARPNADSTDK